MQLSTRTKWVAARSSNTKPPLRHFTQPDHCLLRWCWTGHMMDIPQILLKVQLILLPVSAPFRKHALGSAGHQSWVPLSVPLEVQLTRTSISLSSQKLPSGPNLDSAYGLPTSSKYLSLDGAWMGRRLVQAVFSAFDSHFQWQPSLYLHKPVWHLWLAHLPLESCRCDWPL